LKLGKQLLEFEIGGHWERTGLRTSWVVIVIIFHLSITIILYSMKKCRFILYWFYQMVSELVADGLERATFGGADRKERAKCCRAQP
jgi:hypothetical protein